MGILNIGKTVLAKGAEILAAIAIERNIDEIIEWGEDVLFGDDDNKKEKKKEAFKNHLNNQGQSILNNNFELNNLACKINRYESEGSLDDPFNGDAQESKRKFQSLMKKEMSMIAQRDANQFGIKYQRPIRDMFDN